MTYATEGQSKKQMAPMLHARDMPFGNQALGAEGSGRIQMQQGQVETVLREHMRYLPPAPVKRYLRP